MHSFVWLKPQLHHTGRANHLYVQWSTLRQHVHRVCHGNVKLTHIWRVRNVLILQARPSVGQTPPRFKAQLLTFNCLCTFHANASPSIPHQRCQPNRASTTATTPGAPDAHTWHQVGSRDLSCYASAASLATSSDPQGSCRCVADCSLRPAWRITCANLGW